MHKTTSFKNCVNNVNIYIFNTNVINADSNFNKICSSDSGGCGVLNGGCGCCAFVIGLKAFAFIIILNKIGVQSKLNFYLEFNQNLYCFSIW